ncbi:Nn.00g074220.m01.CDS01 [Neocucurbitaria sp. VM-36]
MGITVGQEMVAAGSPDRGRAFLVQKQKHDAITDFRVAEGAVNKSSLEKSDKEPTRTRRPVKKTSLASTPTRIAQPSPNINTASTGSQNVTIDLDIPNFGEAWDMLDIDVSAIEDLDDGTLLDATPSHQTDAYGIPAHHTCQPGQLVHISTPSIPTMPNYQLRSFAQNPAIKGGTQTTAMLMARILTSYPMMMRSEDSLPPFIHPFSLSDVSEPESKSVESLTTCMSLMQMISTNAQGSRKLLWKNVRLECERLQGECFTLDRWELLSSMQALLIYILVRLHEGETLYNNFDVLLLSTVWMVSCALNQQLGNVPCGAPSGLGYGPSQKDWIFEESRRRLAVIFKSIRMIFSLEPAAGCELHDGFLLAPLPARKQLWEARDEGSWFLEQSRDVGLPSVFGVMSNGQMVKINEHQALLDSDMISLQTERSVESNSNWEEWCSGMDGLGGLVMLAASLPAA